MATSTYDDGENESNNNIHTKKPKEDVAFLGDCVNSGDYRLLMYQSDGSAVWEMPMNTEADGRLSGLKQYAESACLALDLFQRHKTYHKNDETTAKLVGRQNIDSQCSEMTRSLITKGNLGKVSSSRKTSNTQNTEELWKKAAGERDFAAAWLSNATAIFDLLLGTVNAHKGKRFLKLTPCHSQKELFDYANSCQLKSVKIAFIMRQQAIPPLISSIQEARKEISFKGMADMEEFWMVIRELRKKWTLKKKIYSEVDFEQSDVNYPFVPGFIIELINIPSHIWNTSVQIAPGVGWNSFPFAAPFGPIFAQIILKRAAKISHTSLSTRAVFSVPMSNSASHGSVNANKPISEQQTKMLISLELYAAYLVEYLYCLSVRINLIDVEVFGKEILNKGCTFPQTSAPIVLKNMTSRTVYEYLNIAQWVIIDKAIFTVICSLADEQRTANDELMISGKFVSQRTVLTDFAQMMKSLRITCTHLDAKEIAFNIKNIPLRIHRTSPDAGPDTSILTDISMLISHNSCLSLETNANVDIAVNDVNNIKPNQIVRNNEIYDYNCSNHLPCTPLHTYRSLIQAIEELVLCNLRSIFLQIWKLHSYKIPKYMADFNAFENHDFAHNNLLLCCLKTSIEIICSNLYLYTT